MKQQNRKEDEAHRKEMQPVYADQAATSFPKAPGVVEAMVHYLKDVGANVNRGSYESASEAEECLFDTRQMLTELFSGGDPRNTVFTPNITSSLNMILKGFLRPGDHVLTSSMEHNAVMRPLQQLKKSIGISFDRIPARRDGTLCLEEAEGLLRPETRLLVSTHASNVCGTLMPIQELGLFCERHGLFFAVDSAQTAGAIPLDLSACRIDACAFTGHKGLLGPQGVGGFLLSERMVPLMEPLISGGTGSISHTEEIPAFMPDRFEPGTLNLPGIYGLKAALTFLQSVSLSEIRKKEMELTECFLKEALEIPGLILYGKKDIEDRVSVIALNLEGMDPAYLADELDQRYGIRTRVGLHCAPAAHRSLGTYPEGCVRFSFGYFNSEEEVLRCSAALRQIAGERS